LPGPKALKPFCHHYKFSSWLPFVTSRFRSRGNRNLRRWHHTAFQQNRKAFQKFRLRRRISHSRPGPKPGEAGAKQKLQGKPVVVRRHASFGCSAFVKTSLQPSPSFKAEICRSRELRCFRMSQIGASTAKSEAATAPQALGSAIFFCCNKTQTGFPSTT